MNPYTHSALAIPGDRVVRDVNVKWIPSPYGPLFTLMSYPLATLPLVAAMWTFKASAAVAGLALVALVWKTAARRGHRPISAACFVGLNPVLLAWGVGSGHNDMLVAVALMAAVFLATSSKERSGGAAAVAAAAIKPPAALMLPFLIAGARDRRSAVLAATMAVAAAGATFLVAFGGEGVVGFVEVMRTQNGFRSHASVPSLLSSLFLGGGGEVGPALRVTGAAIFLAVTAWLLQRTFRGADWVSAVGWSLLALLLTTSWLMPWYLPLLLPLAAVGASRALRSATLALTGFIVVTRLALPLS